MYFGSHTTQNPEIPPAFNLYLINFSPSNRRRKPYKVLISMNCVGKAMEKVMVDDPHSN